MDVRTGLTDSGTGVNKFYSPSSVTERPHTCLCLWDTAGGSPASLACRSANWGWVYSYPVIGETDGRS